MTAEYTFSNAHRTLSTISHVRGHKISCNIFYDNEIIQSAFSNHNGIKLDNNSKRKTGKFTDIWNINNALLTKSID